MKISAKQEGKKKGGGAGLIAGVAAAVIVVVSLIIGSIVLVIHMNGARDANTADAVETTEKKSVITAENAEEVLEEMLTPDENPGPAYYTVVQNTEWSFPDGNSPSTDAYVENDRENETPVYFDVIVDATGETVYSSPILSLGAKLDSIQLDTALSAGDYDCTVRYHLVDEEQNELTSVDVGTIVHILK